MIFRNLDLQGDWSFGQGLSNYIAKNAAISLNIKTRLLSWLNDCFFDMNAGIDWTNRLGSKNQRALLERDLRRVILQSYGVTAIVTFDTVLVGRQFTANYTIDTIFTKNFADTVQNAQILPPTPVAGPAYSDGFSDGFKITG